MFVTPSLHLSPPPSLQLGSSVEKMSMIDAHSGFPTDAAGFMVHQVRLCVGVVVWVWWWWCVCVCGGGGGHDYACVQTGLPWAGSGSTDGASWRLHLHA